MALRFSSSFAVFIFIVAGEAHAGVVDTIGGYVPPKTASVKNCITRVTGQWVGELPPPSTTKTCNLRKRKKTTEYANITELMQALDGGNQTEMTGASNAMESKVYSYQVVLKYRDSEMYSNKTAIVYKGESSLPENCLEGYLDRQIKKIESQMADRMCAHFDGSDRMQLAELPAHQAPRGGTVAN